MNDKAPVNEQKRYARLGLFVVLAMGLLVAGVFLLGGRSAFQRGFVFETYFDGSVAGLEIGAPVRFRGVPMGQVTEILTSFEEYESDVPIPKRRTYIIVRATIDGGESRSDSLKRDFDEYVRAGMRAQTALSGITGQQYLAIDVHEPTDAPPLPFDWTPRYPYLPSAPSLTAAIFESAQQFLARLNEADLPGLTERLNVLVGTLNGKLEDTPVAQLAADASDTLKETKKTLATLNGVLGDPALRESLDNVQAVSGHLRELTEDGQLERTVQSLDRLATRMDGIVADNQYDVRLAVQDVRTTAENLRRLSDELRRNPSGTLLGGPPERVTLPEDSP